MATKRNRQGLTKITSTLQKRARDAEYRLRKRGASEEEIRRMSPRKPASEVAKMKAGELRSYQASLRKFTNQGGWVVIPDTGEVVPKRLVSEVSSNIRKRNKAFEKFRGDIDRLFAHRIPDIATAQKNRPKPRVYGHDVEIPMREPARTKQAWERRLKRSREMLREFNPTRDRSNARFRLAMLCDKAGRTRLANRLRNLKTSYFDVLVNRTDFEEVIQLMYESWATGQTGEVEGYEGEAWGLIRAVMRGMQVY